MSAQTSKEEILKRVQQRGGDYVEAVCGNCAQSTIFALEEDFGAVKAIPLRALTAMSGIALRGETCGAVVGALLALGILTGRENEEFLEAFPGTMERATRFCDAFEKELGSLICKHIHTRLFGRVYDLADPVQQQEFLEAGGLTKCRAPVETASRLVAEIILGEEA